SSPSTAPENGASPPTATPIITRWTGSSPLRSLTVETAVSNEQVGRRHSMGLPAASRISHSPANASQYRQRSYRSRGSPSGRSSPSRSTGVIESATETSRAYTSPASPNGVPPSLASSTTTLGTAPSRPASGNASYTQTPSPSTAEATCPA